MLLLLLLASEDEQNGSVWTNSALLMADLLSILGIQRLTFIEQTVRPIWNMYYYSLFNFIASLLMRIRVPNFDLLS